MIEEFVQKWEARKDVLRQQFVGKHPENYQEIVKEVIKLMAGDSEYDWTLVTIRANWST